MAGTRFHDRPLRDKLARTGLLLTSAAMAVLLLAVLAYQLVMERAALAEGMRAHAEVIGNNSAAAIMFGSQEEAAELLAALVAIPDITRAELILPDERVFARYRRPGAADGCAARSRDGIGWCSLRVRHKIVLHGQFIGYAAIEASLASLYRGLALQAVFGIAAAALALAVSLAATRRIARAIVGPLQSLVGLTTRVRIERDFTLRAAVESRDEVGQLAHSFNDMMDQLQWHDVRIHAELEQRRQAEFQLNRIAYHDGVTGLHNRHYFKEKLETAVSEVQRYGSSCAVLFIDLDDFKVVNDTLGHEAGDALLLQVADRLRTTLRGSDVVCRIGGDEFAVILLQSVTAGQAEHVAANIIAALTQHFVVCEREVRIGASIGIALCPEHAVDTVTLVRTADTAMYCAKGSGKNNYRLYRPDMEHGALKRFNLEQSLRLAVEGDQFELHYQPLVELADPARLVGFEALLRWNSPDAGRIEPDDFIPLAEKTGLIHAIGDWVMRAAFSQANEWQALCPGLRIGIKLSRRQLDEPDVVDSILRALRDSGLPPALVDVELTEGTLTTDREATGAKLSRLRAAGVRVVLDGFGGGQSSLEELERYPVDALKIDRGFVTRLPGKADDAAIACAIIGIARGFALDLVAGGVETEGQADFLRHAGCRLAQGFLFANALDTASATALAAVAGAARASH